MNPKPRLKSLADQAVKIAAPIIVAAVLSRAATGKLDLKAALLAAVDEAVRRARAPKAP